MRHLGDITKISLQDYIDAAWKYFVHCVIGGSPCQDLSVAGKRSGLSGERSGLFMEQIRIQKEMKEYGDTVDDGAIGRFMVWENVPGAFSSGTGVRDDNGEPYKGEDFRCVLEECARICEPNYHVPTPPKGKWDKAGVIIGDGWSLAWDTRNAADYGVPQRRNRIALVLDTRGYAAPEILFKSSRLPRNLEQGRKARKGTAGTPADCAGADSFQERGGGKPGGGKGILIQEDHVGALSTLNNQRVCYRKTGHPQTAGQPQGWEETDTHDTLNVHDTGETRASVVAVAYSINHQGGNVEQIISDETGTLTAAMNSSGNNKVSVAYGISSYDSNAMKSSNPNSGFYEADTARTLDGNCGSPVCNQGGTAVVSLEGNGQRPSHKGDGYSEKDEMYTLNTTEVHGVAYELPRAGIEQSDTVSTLVAAAGNAPTGTTQDHYIVLEEKKSAGFCTEHSAQARGIGYEEEKSPTLRAGVTPAVVVLDSYGGQAESAKETDVCSTLKSTHYKMPPCVVENHPADSRVDLSKDDTVQTLTSRMGTGGGNVPLILDQQLANGNDVTGCLMASGYDKLGAQEMMSGDYTIVQKMWDGSDTCPTLTANNAGGNQRMPDKDNFNAVITLETYHCVSDEDCAMTLKARDYKDPQCVTAVDVRNSTEDAELNGTLQHDCYKNVNSNNVIRENLVVRRLTPMECERLQGYPDGWTDIGEWVDSKGKTHKPSDSVRYKALGNSIATVAWADIIENISEVIRRDYGETPKMASLFDGIAGFPLLWERCNGKGTAVWASEIEEFPIAVTKIRFPEVEDETN